MKINLELDEKEFINLMNAQYWLGRGQWIEKEIKALKDRVKYTTKKIERLGKYYAKNV